MGSLKRWSVALAAAFCLFAFTGATYPYTTVAGYGTSSGLAPSAFPIVACDTTYAVNISTATTTQIVPAPAATKSIYVCDFAFTLNGTTPSVQFEYGTGSNCGTGTTALTGAYAPTSGSYIEHGGNGVGTIMRLPAATALCIVSGGTTPVIGGEVGYAIF